MAKAPQPTTTRLQTTVNARYYPGEGVADAYCLDGKFPGKRETRTVNLTLDREARSFLISVFAYPTDARTRQETWQAPLVKLSAQLADLGGEIDTDINDLAEAALDVTGGLKLAEEEGREPYFSSIIVRDGEIASVTVGEGLAFIYRQGVLYPLTSHGKELEAIDVRGDRVEGIFDFIAGEAGAIRYSNIAQVEDGDLVVLCNGELYDVVGQKELMRLLGDAEDEMDAAASLLTAAASQMPGTPMQVAVTRISQMKASEQQTSKFSLGRFATQAMEPVVIPEAPPVDPAFARTQRYERQDMIDRGRREPPREEEPAWDLPTMPVSEATEPFESVVPRMGGFDEERPFDDFFEESAFGQEEADLPVFAYSPDRQKRRRQEGTGGYGDYDRRDLWDTGDDLDAPRGYDPYGDDYDDYDDGYSRKPKRGSDQTRRLVFYAILIAIIVICIVALIKLLGGSKKPVETEPPETSPSISVPVEQTTPPTQTEPPEETEPPEPTSVDRIHVVVTGDSWWGICMRYYDRASETLCEKLAEYNDMSVTNLYVGNEIAIPPLSELLGD